MSEALEFPFKAIPPIGSVATVAPGIEWLRMPLPFALNHINLWLVQDGASFAAIDTGYALPETREAWKSALAGRRLARSIVTHCHPDHLGNAAWLEAEFGAPMWITQGEYVGGQMIAGQIAGFAVPAMLALFRRHGLDAVRHDALVNRGNAYKKGVPDIPATFRRLLDGQLLRIGDHDWRVIVGYGHSPEHASLYCADLGILISGDMLLPRISTNVAVWACNPDDNPLQLFLDSIDGFLELPPDTLVLPSHGLPFRGLHERVRQLHEHHAARCALLSEACSVPQSATELIPVLFDRDIPDAHQTMFAMGEAIAHLNYLEHRGELRRIASGDDGVIRYLSS